MLWVSLEGLLKNQEKHAFYDTANHNRGKNVSKLTC